MAMVPQERWVETDAGRIFVKQWEISESPTSTPIILLHDSLGCVQLWRDFPLQLAETLNRSVVAYDRLGFGKSDPHAGPIKLDFIEQEARGSFRAVVQQLALSEFVVFGHSVGGGMAICCGAEYPATCRGVIAESAQVFVEELTLQGIRNAEQSFAAPAQLERLRRYHGDKAEWVLDAWTSTWLSPAFESWTLDTELRHLRCPLLAIHGSKDDFGSAAHLERIGTRTKDATIEMMTDAGHTPHRENAGAVINSVRDWLCRTSPLSQPK